MSTINEEIKEWQAKNFSIFTDPKFISRQISLVKVEQRDFEKKSSVNQSKNIVQIKTPSMSKTRNQSHQKGKVMRTLRPLSPPTQTMIPQSLLEEQQRFQHQQQMIYQQQMELQHAEMRQLELLQWEHQRLMQQNMMQMQKPQYYYDARGMLCTGFY